jgi:hypothetical protein
MSSGLKQYDLTGQEEWREYEWIDMDNRTRVYRISNPVTLYLRPNVGTTHRVVDTDGVTHIVPAVGQLGCIIRFKGKVVF